MKPRQMEKGHEALPDSRKEEFWPSVQRAAFSLWHLQRRWGLYFGFNQGGEAEDLRGRALALWEDVHSLYPRKVITGCYDTPLMNRYYLRERTWGRAFLHVFHRGDEDRELHCHPFDFTSFILSGGYVEETEEESRFLAPGMVVSRPAEWRHRVVMESPEPAITLVFVTRPRREWGFWQGETFIPQSEFFERSERCEGKAEAL